MGLVPPLAPLVREVEGLGRDGEGALPSSGAPEGFGEPGQPEGMVRLQLDRGRLLDGLLEERQGIFNLAATRDRRLGNRPVFKRLGFIVERLGIEAQDLLAECRDARSTGYTRLDPSGPARGRLLRRWGLQVNVEVPAGR